VVFDGFNKLYECKTIELPWKENARQISCIPGQGKSYKCIQIVSPSKGTCFHIQDVPGRDAVLIHKGNYATGRKVDTLGCILPGMYFMDINKDGYPDVADSTTAMEMLLKILPDTFTLTIF